jgi:hypothetical protein
MTSPPFVGKGPQGRVVAVGGWEDTTPGKDLWKRSVCESVFADEGEKKPLQMEAASEGNHRGAVLFNRYLYVLGDFRLPG